ncbi:MAG: outer membrane beta-barrel protein [Alphaproteobacteria bacterium]|nr:outer membrane beta-barrel protein [Alphaproteobacteria bacterium]
MTNKSWVFAAAFATSLSMAGAASAQNSNFEGFYVGGQAGWSIVEADGSITGVGTFDDDGDGLGGGGFIGYGGTNGILYGSIEAELGWDGADWSGTVLGTPAEVETRLTGGVSFRVGAVVADNLLLYGRIGWVRTNAEATHISISTQDENFDGLRGGAGVEGKFGNVGIRGQYTYTDYDDPDIPGWVIDAEQHLFRVGVAYYF